MIELNGSFSPNLTLLVSNSLKWLEEAVFCNIVNHIYSGMKEAEQLCGLQSLG
jgi:hypothetical protein